MPIPCSCSSPSTALDSPTTEATDRSISPVMMTSVIGSAMSRMVVTSSSRYVSVSVSPKYGMLL